MNTILGGFQLLDLIITELKSLFVYNRGDTILRHGGLHTNSNKWKRNSAEPGFEPGTVRSEVDRANHYSRMHKSSDSFFSKILEKPSIVQRKMIPHINGLHFSMRWSKKKISKWPTKNSKWPPQKTLIFQLRQFSIFFHEIFMDWSLG